MIKQRSGREYLATHPLCRRIDTFDAEWQPTLAFTKRVFQSVPKDSYYKRCSITLLMGEGKEILPQELRFQALKVLLYSYSNVSISEFVEEVEKFSRMLEKWRSAQWKRSLRALRNILFRSRRAPGDSLMGSISFSAVPTGLDQHLIVYSKARGRFRPSIPPIRFIE